MSTSADKNFIVANLGHRMETYYKMCNIQIGMGNTDADILMIQPQTKMPKRDAITGALKNFGMLNDSYRATSTMIDGDDGGVKLNRYYLRELIQIINPLVVVTCGVEATSLMKEKNIRSFTNHTGKKFHIEDIPSVTFYATINPSDYGFACAPLDLKDQGRAEWTRLASIYRKLKESKERSRWD